MREIRKSGFGEGYGAEIRINLLTFMPMDRKTGYNLATVRRIIETIKNRHEELIAERSLSEIQLPNEIQKFAVKAVPKHAVSHVRG
jgi:hypothetical protein